MSGAASMRARLGVGKGAVPAQYDWDARFNVVDDGAGLCSQWTDTIAGSVAPQASVAARPAINNVIAANTTLSYVGSSQGLGPGPIANFGQQDAWSMTCRTRHSQLNGNVLLTVYNTTSSGQGFTRCTLQTTGVAYQMVRGSNVSATATGSLSFAVNVWYTHGFAWANDTLHYYRDGVFVATLPLVYAIPGVMNGAFIGNTINAAGSGVRGYYARVKIYIDTLIPAAQHLKDHQAYAALWA